MSEKIPVSYPDPNTSQENIQWRLLVNHESPGHRNAFWGIAFDAFGNIFFCDVVYRTVRFTCMSEERIGFGDSVEDAAKMAKAPGWV